MCAPVPVPRGTDLTASSCLFSAPLAPLALVFLCLTFSIHLLHFSAAYVPGAEEQGPRVGRIWALSRGNPRGTHSRRRLLFRRGPTPRAVAAGLTRRHWESHGVEA